MIQNNNLKTQSKLETQSSKYEFIKKIPFKTIIGTGIIVSIITVIYKNFDKICYYYNIIKNLVFLNLGYKLTNKCIKIITTTNLYNKNKLIILPTINKTKIIKDIINITFRGVKKFIKK